MSPEFVARTLYHPLPEKLHGAVEKLYPLHILLERNKLRAHL